MLYVEDVVADVELAVRELEKAGFQVSADVVLDAQGFAQRLRSQSYDIVLADYRLPGWTGIAALEYLQQQGIDIPFILVTGTLGDDTAVECIKKGAWDYVLKDRLARLPHAVRRALEEKKFRDEQVQAEVALRLSEEKFFKAFQCSPDAITITTLAEGRYVDVNDGFVHLTGYRREEVIGRTAFELGVWADPEERRRLVSRVLGHVRVRDEEIIFWGKSGEERVGSFSAEIIELNGEKYLLAVTRDITEQKRAEQERLRTLQLRAENEALARANQMKTEFLANMSHELRTPLNSILGFSELLLSRDEDRLTPQQRQEIGIIFQKGQHLLALVNDLLDLAQIESGQVPLEPSLLAVRDLAVCTLDAFAPRLEEKNLQHRVEVEPPDLTVYADARRLEEILTNLIANAVRFTPQGGVTVRASLRDDRVLFCVEDTGVGIEPKDLPYIFDKFYQARQQAEGARTGTGLGLAITKQLVELHGGTIWVESTPGQGSRFFFTLPRAPESGASAELGAPRESEGLD